MASYHLNVFLQKVFNSLLYLRIAVIMILIVPTVSEIRNSKPDVDPVTTSANTAVTKSLAVNNGEQIASEEKLRGMMTEVNQTLKMLSGSVTADNSSINQISQVFLLHVCIKHHWELGRNN